MTVPVTRVRDMPFYPLHEPAAETPDGRPMRRLNLNESPFPPAPAVIDAMTQALTRANRYPDGEASALVSALAQRSGVAPGRIFVGSGSNELLAASAEISLEAGDEMLAPVPAFPTYEKLAIQRGARFVGVPTTADGRIDLEAMLAAVTPRTRLVFVSSPHNPTGAVLEQKDLESFVERLPSHAMLHFDEAYYEFGQAVGAGPTLSILEKRKGPWISTRTFSKAHSLAGIRVGYGFAGTEELALAIRKVRSNFGLTSVAIAAGLAALNEQAASQELIAHLLSERERIAAALQPFGFQALPGAANFLALIPPEGPTQWLQALRERGILIIGFRIGDRMALRITIGTQEDSDAVIEALCAIAKGA